MRMVKIPKILHELHGELAPAYAIWTVYLGGTLTAVLFVLLLLNTTTGLEWWKLVISALLMLDIAGGVIANLSRSTNEYYHAPGNERLRAGFLILHIAQPALFALMFPEALLYFALVFLWTLPASYGVTRISQQEKATVNTGLKLQIFTGAKLQSPVKNFRSQRLLSSFDPSCGRSLPLS
jgi:hypothetical protein